VRVIAATNLPWDRLADETFFRPDLLFRLNTVEIEIPPLRERREDILPLIDHYLDHYARKYDKPRRLLPDDMASALRGSDWPGNVRALRHAVERAVILSDNETLTLEDFALARAPVPVRPVQTSMAHDLNLDRAEKQVLEQALKKHAYNITHAAAELGLSRAALYRRMEKHGI
jgi:DNA-binding NtrC family response regulator